MILNDIMKYIESEYKIINSTPCKICGNEYTAEHSEIDLIDGVPYSICYCFCEKCGHEKTFKFCAPFIDNEALEDAKNHMN